MPAWNRHQQLRDQESRCFYCQYQWPRSTRWRQISRLGRRAATTDHMVPLSRGGTQAPENKVICCSLCNSEKAALTAEEFLALRDFPEALATRRREVQLAVEKRAIEENTLGHQWKEPP